MGHLQRNCPSVQKQVSESHGSVQQPPRASAPTKTQGVSRAAGRAYQITPEEARDDPKVVSGTFLVNSQPAHILFDSGASDSFVSLSFARNLRHAMHSIPKPFYVD